MRIPFYRVGACCWIVTGLGHTAGDVVMRLAPPEADNAFDAMLRDHPFELLGTQTSHYDLYMGFSLAMGLAIGLVGLLFLLLERFATQPGQKRSAGMVGFAASSGLLALSIALLPPPPIIFFAIASVAFAAGVFILRHSSPQASRRPRLANLGRRHRPTLPAHVASTMPATSRRTPGATAPEVTPSTT